MFPADPHAALAYGAGRYAAGADGKTLFVGWRGSSPLFALAAGLGGEQDRERFGILGRYLLRRDQADGYWLLLPADMAAGEMLLAQVVTPRVCPVHAAPVWRDATGVFTGLGAEEAQDIAAPLGDMLDGGNTLPALMRRELDRLAQALTQPLPESPR